jgi:hypothetical protein
MEALIGIKTDKRAVSSMRLPQRGAIVDAA